jgi:uncharacterized protein involved in exopolysaccharide biosynthesis
MSDPLVKFTPAMKGTTHSGAWKLCLFWGVLANLVIWGTSGLYLRLVRPTYISEWALVLPGSASGVNINLPEIGQATSSGTSPFGSPTSDPRANYEYIASSEAVLAKAAAAVNLSLEEFGEPRIKLPDNTTILQFQIKGRTAQQAQQNSYALYRALLQKLKQLRAEEIVRRDEGTQATLKSAQTKLKAAQNHLSQYKARSGFSSQSQLSDLSSNIEQLRRQRAEAIAQQQLTTQRLQQLSSSLGLTPQQAANAFVLQSDQRFQLNLKDYSEASTTLEILRSKWGENHPQVIKERSKQQAAQMALMERSRSLTGETVDLRNLEFLQLRGSDQGSGREGLFRDLVTVRAEQQGLRAQIQALEQQLTQLETRFASLAERESVLDTLKRDVQVAEAVFASTVAKLDLGKSDMFTAYPLVQLVAEPSLPDEPASPKTTLILLGSGLSSLFVTIGLVLLWQRNRQFTVVADSPYGDSM